MNPNMEPRSGEERLPLTLLALALTLVVATSACKTRGETSFVFQECRPYQAPEFSVEGFKSPELRPRGQQESVAVAMAISGGGYRATNFGLGVMMALERVAGDSGTHDLLREVDYFSTASGGSLAAGVYISTLVDHLRAGSSPESYSLCALMAANVRDVKRNVERGYRNDLFRSLFDPRMIGDLDRGDALETELDCKVFGADTREGQQSIKLGDMFVPSGSKDDPLSPLWVANATIYENGGVFQFTPDVLRLYGITGYTNRLKQRRLDGDYGSMPISVGAKASASFPGIVAGTTLESDLDPCNPYLHLFDGGLSDNLGIKSAVQILEDVDAERKVLIVVDAYNGETEPFSCTSGSPKVGQILWKTMNVGLEGNRLRAHLELNQIASMPGMGHGGLSVVYLSFDDVDPKLREAARQVPTDFNISRAQQDVLFQAGSRAVEAKSSDLLRAILRQG